MHKQASEGERETEGEREKRKKEKEEEEKEKGDNAHRHFQESHVYGVERKRNSLSRVSHRETETAQFKQAAPEQ